MDELMKKALDTIDQRSDISTEIQHPTDLLTLHGYYQLTYLLMLLGVLPHDVHLMGTKYWEEYDI